MSSPTKTNRVIKLPQATITFRADGIVHIHYNEFENKLAESIEVFEVTRKNCDWEVSPFYLTGADFAAMDKESKEFYGSPAVTKHCSAIAMLTEHIAARLVANFFIMVIKPAVPTRMFNSEEEAIKWLRGFETIDKK